MGQCWVVQIGIGTWPGIIDHIIAGITHRIPSATHIVPLVATRSVHCEAVKHVDIARRQVPAHNVIITSRGFDIRHWFIVRVALVIAVSRRLTKAFGLKPTIPEVGTPHKFERAILDRNWIEGDPK